MVVTWESPGLAKIPFPTSVDESASVFVSLYGTIRHVAR